MLEWQLKNADKLKRLEQLKAMKEAGQDVPFLNYIPEVHPQHFWLWEGFLTLSSQRWHGHEGALQPIPVSEIKAYAEYQGMADEADREDFLFIVIQLDGILREHMAEKTNRAREKQIAQAKKQQAAKPRGRKR